MKIMCTCDDKLTISFNNQGIHVRDNIVKTAKNESNTTALQKGEEKLGIWFTLTL